MTTLLDLLLLMVISKEALELGPRVSVQLWATFVLALPWLLGMASSMREKPQFLRNPVRGVIAQGLTVMSVVIFVGLVTYDGLAAAFWGLFVLTLLAYIGGRATGMTVKALVGVIVIALAVLLSTGGLGLR